MKFKTKFNTTIEYILIANDPGRKSMILMPDEFNNDVIDFIKMCPQDVMQLQDSLRYFELTNRYLWNYGYDFSIFYHKDYQHLKNLIDSSTQIQLFFIDGNRKEHINLYNELKKEQGIRRYFHFYNDSENKIEDKRIIYSPYHFVKALIDNQSEILNYLEVKKVVLNSSLPENSIAINEEYNFTPARTNYYLINKLLGNFDDSVYEDEEETEKKLSIESKEAQKKPHSFERQVHLQKQLILIDKFTTYLLEKELLKSVSNSPIYSPLVLVVPFHNPDLKDILNDKELANLLQVEQTENYINITTAKTDMDLTVAGIKFIQLRSNYLDNISFLHSSFNFSPVIRLPVKGKSIYRELSFFRIKVFPNLNIARNRQKLKKTIYRFGKMLKEATVCDSLEKYITKRNGQIVAVSDLPIEWMIFNDIPLSFTHDVCRLPETPLPGLMSLYASNSKFEFTISKSIIQKTLVIIGSSDEGFMVWQEQAKKLSKELNFKVRICNKVNEVKEAIVKEKPEFLILDCHGGYDEKTRSTYLNIGKERLDGNYIVKNNLTIPIVFLSACGTAPTYGTFNSISNAFFESGSISVTTTYLPISIDRGSTLYLRILNKLVYASNHCIHKNWLEFICHIIRTSSINEAYLIALDKNSEINLDNYTESNTQALVESLIFKKRRNLYKNMDKKISQFTKKNRLYYSEVIPEYLLYSNLGRGDLILFDVWKEEFLKKNTQ